MRIEKIELIGFKSFAEKTVFNLHPGITCIVGPNGCGKSNIVDSFRWVLGEQSAKSLRGEKMEEVIFNGSATKKPKGMTEVTLVASGMNSVGQGNGEDSRDSTSVTRRLYRSGDSEYMVNRTPSRLKDIRDLFLDTGLEVRSYSILEQGRIGEILNSKPQDRRFLIEEVAGVMKYKVRRAEALSKLESSRLNLQRINDIVAEVKRQINSLDRQAKKAERYKRLSSELRAIELKIAKRDYTLLRESLDRILSEYNTLKEEETLNRAELTKIENITETRRIELVDKEKSLEALQLELQGLEREIAEIERMIAVSRTDRDNLREYLTKLRSQDGELEQKRTDVVDRQKELDSLEAKLSMEIDGYREYLKEKNEFLKIIEEELSERENLIESKRREAFRVSEEFSNIRNELNKLQSALDALERREGAAVRESDASKKTLDEIDSSIKDIEAASLSKNNEILLMNEKKGILLNEIDTYKNREEQIRGSLSKEREELASFASRLESLREIVFDNATRELLSEGENFHFIASISDVLEVRAEYEKAVENVLAEKVNGFILSSFEDVEIAISVLKTRGLGRTAFIPLNKDEGGRIKEEDRVVEEQGIIGKAVDLVNVNEAAFSGVIRNLLENVIIVKDLRTAIDLVKAGHEFLFVTIDGEIIEPTGAVIGGEGRGVLKRKREIRELEAVIEEKRNNIERIHEDLNRIQLNLTERESSLKNIGPAIVDAEKEISLLRLTAENYRGEKERTSRKLAYLTIELEEVVKEKESTKKLIIERESEIQAFDLKRDNIEQTISDIQEEITKNRTHYEEHRASATDLKLLITSYKERIESLNKERESSIKTLDELSQKNNFLINETSSVESRITQRDEEMRGREAKIRSLVSAADDLRVRISKKKEAIEEEANDLLATGHELKALRHKIDSLTARISELDVARAEHRLKIENLHENIRQNYGMEIDTLEVEPLLPEDEERLTELRTKIQELGPVNLGTLEEYEELKTRYEFLTKQQDDLNRSIAELEEAITKINSSTRRKLREAFDILNAKFSEVFTRLFGGGRAELIMTDENNILETGIDIIAQPLGKKLQNINLLSGGEKALTALSLLFASFLIKPAPLCILDEADAPLDESNTERFAKMLQELSKEIQFIIVTHNRTTMEVADYIYGITMEEPGMSKVISMQLVEA